MKDNLSGGKVVKTYSVQQRSRRGKWQWDIWEFTAEEARALAKLVLDGKKPGYQVRIVEVTRKVMETVTK